MHDLKPPRGAGAARPVYALAIVGLGAALPALDLAVNIAFPAITAAFSLETQAIRWVVAAYVVCYAGLMLAFGSLGDAIGHRRVFRAGLLLGAAAFVLCGLAPSYGWLLAARTVQGVSAALLLSCAPALATGYFEDSRRLWVLGAYSSMAAAAALFAPLLGGLSIALLGWSGVFWFRVPIALLALVLLPEAPPQPRSARGFDARAAALLAAGIALLLLAPTLVQSMDSLWPPLAAASFGAMLLLGFASRQRRSTQKILPLSTLADQGFVLLNFASCAVQFAGFAVPLLVPYFLARISGYGPLESGGVMTLWPLGMLVGSLLAVPCARTLGRGATALLGGALLAGGEFAVGLWSIGATPLGMLPALLLHGAGIGLFQVAYTDNVIATLPRQDRGVAGSLTMLTRTAGIVIGAAALSAGLHWSEARHLASGLPADAAFLGAYQSVFRYTAFWFAAIFALSSIRRGALARE